MEIGRACFDALDDAIEPMAIGIYLIRRDRPILLYSQNAPVDLIGRYERNIGANDRLILHISRSRLPVDGASLYGESHWHSSPNFALLSAVGLRHCMATPLEFDGRFAGAIFTAKRSDHPFQEDALQYLHLLGRAASLSLLNSIQAEELGFASPPEPRRTGAELPAPTSTVDPLSGLPPRSRAVAVLVCRGQSNKEIAREMRISAYTVKDHIEALCRRFSVCNRTELAVRLLAPGRIGPC